MACSSPTRRSARQRRGGLSISIDHGRTWRNLTRASGLADTSISGVSGDGSNICAATENGLSISKDSGVTWKRVGKG